MTEQANQTTAVASNTDTASQTTAVDTTKTVDTTVTTAQQPDASKTDTTVKTDVVKTDAAKTDTTNATKVDAPIEYAEFKAPEGVTLDPELTTEFKTFASENKLNQDSAQKMVDMGVKLQAKFADTIKTNIEKTQAQWLSETEADKEIGGDKLKENVAVANKALGAFGTPALIQLLKDTGLANHPEVIRAFYKAGKTISEDNLVTGSKDSAASGGTAFNAAANALYGGKK